MAEIVKLRTKNLKRPKKKKRTKSVDDFGVAGEPRALIPVADYLVAVQGYKVAPYHGVYKIYIELRVIDSGYEGTTIYAIYQKYDVYRPACYFYRDWSTIMGRPPQKRERIGPRDFNNRLLKIRVRTVIKDNKGRPLAEFQKYSVLDYVINFERAIDATKPIKE